MAQLHHVLSSDMFWRSTCKPIRRRHVRAREVHTVSGKLPPMKHHETAKRPSLKVGNVLGTFGYHVVRCCEMLPSVKWRLSACKPGQAQSINLMGRLDAFAEANAVRLGAWTAWTAWTLVEGNMSCLHWFTCMLWPRRPFYFDFYQSHVSGDDCMIVNFIRLVLQTKVGSKFQFFQLVKHRCDVGPFMMPKPLVRTHQHPWYMVPEPPAQTCSVDSLQFFVRPSLQVGRAFKSCKIVQAIHHRKIISNTQ
jgi:hypothetical protein